MSSYWDDNYVFGPYSGESWVPETVPTGVSDSNEQEEVVSSVQGKQNRPFLDLNTHPPVDETSSVDDSYNADNADEPCYPAQQGYPDYGYRCEYSYVQQHYPDGYGGDGGQQQFISPSNSYIRQNYLDVGGYGGEAPPSRAIRTSQSRYQIYLVILDRLINIKSNLALSML
ncbi:hypothetical protein HanRHA438_Chr16g0751871 [Helianthus annuus]|nr:hypothetical protein HanRHA438_Chr16g0751871 [Helianthus annuus]